jgi:hypothetical protein
LYSVILGRTTGNKVRTGAKNAVWPGGCAISGRMLQ